MLWKYPAWVIGSFLILVVFCNHVLLSFSIDSIAGTGKEQLDSVQKLRSFALSKINDDRNHYGLTSLVMSNNTAAQIHADEILKTKTLSHLSIEGFKPYML